MNQQAIEKEERLDVNVIFILEHDLVCAIIFFSLIYIIKFKQQLYINKFIGNFIIK